MNLSDAWAGLFERRAFGLLHEMATHNVGVDDALDELYGRDEWMQHLAVATAGLQSVRVVDRRGWTAAGSDDTACFVNVRLSASGAEAGDETRAVEFALLALVASNRIYRAWQVLDAGTSAVDDSVLQRSAHALAGSSVPRGDIPWEYGEVRAALGQLAPGDTSGAIPGASASVQKVLAGYARGWNERRPDRLSSLGVELPSGDSHPFTCITSALPDGVLFIERACVAPDDAQVGLVWRWIGRHLAAGLGAEPSGCRLHVRGLARLELAGDRISRERVFWDRTAPLRDIALRQRSR